jgi:exosome complex RNA-binding protein Rrp42 (RNase PH superfamily)
MMVDVLSTISVLSINKSIIIDSTTEEKKNQDGGLMVACIPS